MQYSPDKLRATATSTIRVGNKGDLDRSKPERSISLLHDSAKSHLRCSCCKDFSPFGFDEEPDHQGKHHVVDENDNQFVSRILHKEQDQNGGCGQESGHKKTENIGKGLDFQITIRPRSHLRIMSLLQTVSLLWETVMH